MTGLNGYVVLPSNFKCSNVSIFSLSIFEAAYQKTIIFPIKINNAYTLHLTHPSPTPPPNRISRIKSHGICQLLCCITWGEIKNIILFVTQRQIIVSISCGKFRGGSLTVNAIKIYATRMPTLFFIHFSIRFNYLLIF